MEIKGTKELRKWEQDQAKKANKVKYGFTITKKLLQTALHTLTLTEKVIYLNLRLYASPEGHCWPSMRHQARDLGADKNIIQKNIKTLQDKGFVKISIRKGKGGKRFEYWLLK